MTRIRLKLYLLCIYCFVNTNAFAQIVLNNQLNYSLDGYVYGYIEQHDNLNINQIFDKFKKGEFVKVATAQNEFYRPLVQNIYWLAIPVRASADGATDLETGIGNSGIYTIKYFLLTNRGQILAKHIIGKTYSFNSRAVKSRHYYFPLCLRPNQPAIIFFRLDKRGDGLNAPVRLLRKSYREKNELSSYFQYAFFMGIMVFVVFFSLVAFLWIRNRMYLYHSLYVLCCSMFFLADGDLDYVWLYPNWPKWASIAPSMYSVGIIFFMILFMSKFLNLKNHHPKLFTLSFWCGLGVATLFLLIPLGYIFNELAFIRIGIYYYGAIILLSGWVSSIYCIIRRIIEKDNLAYLYGLAVFWVVLACIIYMLQSLAVIKHNFLPFNYLLFSFIIEIFILSLGLIYGFNYFKAKHYELSISFANEQFNFGKKILEAQQAEQLRISRDLHDEIGGNLAAMKLTLQRFDFQDEKLTLLNYLIDTASNSARHIAHNLIPPGFDMTNLPHLLEIYLKHLNINGTILFRFYSNGHVFRFNKQKDLMIYRIVLELINNVVKHSKAKESTVQLIYNTSNLEIMAEDNGRGFDLQKCKKGMGLNNIYNRTGYLNGNVNIDSGKGGTTIIIQIPYVKND